MAKCKVCGAELVKGDLFCGECGAKVEPQTDEEDVSQDEDEEEEEVEETPAASSTDSGSQSSGDSNNPDNGLIPCCVLSIIGIVASAILLNKGWNKTGCILAIVGAFFALPSISAKSKKNTVFLYIFLVLWICAALYMKIAGHKVTSYISLAGVLFNTVGLCALNKKKIAVIPILLTLGTAAVIFFNVDLSFLKKLLHI
ncbi:MAG: zinc ribbon domain-containing protein [Treponema sp.]|nr:zinc ribbon domain-containing protein [Treponema sp.]